MSSKYEKWASSIRRLAKYKGLEQEDPALYIFVKSLVETANALGE